MDFLKSMGVKPCADTDSSLLEQFEVDEGKRMYAVRLDRFKGQMGVHGSASGRKMVPSSEAYLSERRVDMYLEEIGAVMDPLIRLLGAKTAWDLVLSARNGDRERDRMRAAKMIAGMTEHYRKVIAVLEGSKYSWDIDGYDHHDVWVVKGPIIQPERDALQNVVCALHIEDGKVFMGNGDGYHRGFDERPFCTVRGLSVAVLRRAVMKETARAKREEMEFAK